MQNLQQQQQKSSIFYWNEGGVGKSTIGRSFFKQKFTHFGKHRRPLKEAFWMGLYGIWLLVSRPFKDPTPSFLGLIGSAGLLAPQSGAYIITIWTTKKKKKKAHLPWVDIGENHHRLSVHQNWPLGSNIAKTFSREISKNENFDILATHLSVGSAVANSTLYPWNVFSLQMNPFDNFSEVQTT